MVADAYFSKAAFMNPLATARITVISRLQKDAVGRDDPLLVVGRRPWGPPRKKGQVWQLPTLLGTETVAELTVVIYGNTETLRVVWRDVWLQDVTSKVRVVVLATKGEPLVLVSIDITLPPAVIIQLYAVRFPLKLTLRDLKQYGGLGDYQSYTWLTIHRFVHSMLTSYWVWWLTLLQDQQEP